MDFRAKHRYARTSPQKARYVADMIRGKSVNRALSELAHTPRRASTYMRKLLQSAVANVEDRLANDATLDVEIDDLFIKEVRVDEGPTFKRWRPRSMGRVNQILKRTCHMSIVIAPRPEFDDYDEHDDDTAGSHARATSAAAGGNQGADSSDEDQD